MSLESTPSLFLVGMPGAGKSTVARQLARHCGLAAVDTDAEIERRLGESIRSYFEHAGEASFRDLEERMLDELTDVRPVVLATGGGAVLRALNRQRLHERGTVIYLHASPENLFRRVRHDTKRPLLQTEDPLARLRSLYGQRDPLYRETAHFVVETGRTSVPTLANMIIAQLELAGVLAPRP